MLCASHVTSKQLGIGISPKALGLRIKPEVFLVAVVLLAAFLRFYRLDDFPPTFYRDEAFDGYQAQKVVQTATFPIFFEGNTGAEPLVIYLQALAVFLWGSTSWALRAAPAMVGWLTIPVVYRTAVELFKEEKRARWLGVLAASIVAVSFWGIDISRLMFRAIALPLFGSLTIWCFWRAWRNLRLVDFALSGALLGLTLYTYIPARVFPVALIVFVGSACLLSIARRGYYPVVAVRRVVVGLGILLIIAGVVFTPLAIYFLNNPGAFTQRTNTASIISSDTSETLTDLGENAVNVTRMFIDRGDLNQRQNVPGHPALDLVSEVGFWIGLLIALWYMTSKPVYLLLLIWLGSSLAGTWLSTEAPNFLRAIGALPPASILAADGLTRIGRHLSPRAGLPMLAIIVVLFGGVLTFNDYFNIWGPSRDTFFAFDGPTNVMVQHVLSLSQTSDVILPLSVYVSPQMQFYLRRQFPQGIPFMPRQPHSSAWLVSGAIERTNIVLGRDGVFVPQPFDDAQIAQLKELIQGGQQVESAFGDIGSREVYLEDATDFTASLAPQHRLNAIFGGQVRLFGYAIEPMVVSPGDQVRITYYWQALQDLSSDYVVTTNLLDPRGSSFGQLNSKPVIGDAATSLWSRGEIVPDSFDIQIPAAAHEGKYHLEVGLLNLSARNLLVPLQGTTDHLYLDPLTVARSPVDLDSITHPLGATLGKPPSITLLGYDLDPNLRAGETVALTLFWRAEAPLPKDYSVFIHFIDSNGNMRAQQDGPPQNGNAPTSWWNSGDLFADAHQLQLPTDLAAGQYILELGVYDPASGVRLPMFDAQGTRQPNDRWQIPVEVLGP